MSKINEVCTVCVETPVQTKSWSECMHSTHTEQTSFTDWKPIAALYFRSTMSLRAIAGQCGVSDTAIRKHAKRHGWQRPSAASMPTARGVAVLARSLEAQLAAVDGVVERSRRFVAAMIQLDAAPAVIADALGVSEKALNLEFGDEYHFHTARRGR